MIAQVVFDLPLEGPFDYSIPEHLIPAVTLGVRVKVSFSHKQHLGFVTGLLQVSSVDKLKPIQSVCDPAAVFNQLDLDLAREFAAYYGCSLGEALGSMLRNKKAPKPSVRRDRKPKIALYSTTPGCYADKIKEIMEDYRSRSNAEKSSFLILVPDIFRGEMLASQLKGLGPFKIGMRSSVFESDAQFDCVIMVDDEDPSFKQEQMPMYETRQVLLMRSYLCGFDIAVVAIAPSVELMALAREGRVKFIDGSKVKGPAARLVDLTNYKFVPGLISPAVRDALQAALKTGQKGILVLNRRGSYRLTRCVDCGEILKCSHCDASLIYSKSEGRFLCRHCTYSVPGDTVCPKCRKYHWRSQGIGVEQVQAELKKLFPTAKVAAFERPSKNEGKLSLPDFDILISTSAVLRFQASLKVQVAAFIDFDAQLNRLDMRSAFNAFSLAQHISAMSHEGVLIQTRHIHHYVLQSLSSGKVKDFYEEELSLRKEFGFMPFKHWVKISWRGKQEKALQEHASKVYNMLSRSLLEDMTTTPPLADVVGRKRDQFRFNVMLQAEQVVPAVALIRSILTKMRQPSRAIVTLNVDP